MRFFAVFFAALFVAGLTFSLSGCDAVSEILGGLGFGGGEEPEDGKGPGNGDSPPPPVALNPGDTVVEITGPGESGATTVWNPSEEGYYMVELWGSQGWNPPPETDSGNQYGGKGAYVRGIMEITEGEKGQTLFVTVGIGTDPTNLGHGEGAGGGASDVRWEADTLYDRIIVAAGGGGSHNRQHTDVTSTPGYSTAGHGGALTGGNSSGGYSGQDGSGGSQTAGGAAGTHTGAVGMFGKGGYLAHSESVGQGGYGYWGGGSGGLLNYNGGGGGGSSFISGYSGCVAITGTITGEDPVTRDTVGKTDEDPTEKAAHYSGKVFVPSVTIGGTAYTTEMIAGNAAMPAPDGGTETGHSGGGYARVVYLGKPST